MKDLSWREVVLGEVLTRSEEWIDIEPEENYREITVRLWGKGVTKRRDVRGSEIAASSRLRVRSGQFILSRIDARNGAFGLIPDALDGAIVSNDFPAFASNPSRLLPSFLNWMSKTRKFADICKAASEGTTNRVRLKEDRFLKTKIFLPRLSEQQRIVARIEELAAKIDEARELRNKALAQTNVFYTSILTSITEQRDKSWKQEKVSDILLTMDAGWSPQCEKRAVNGSEWGILKTTSVQWGEFLHSENKALPNTLKPRPEYSVRAGDVLVTRAGPRKRVGVVASVREDYPQLMISDKLIRLRPDPSKVVPRFLELSLASPFSQEYLVKRKTGLADAQVNISQDILKSTPITYPRLADQRRIVTFIDELKLKVTALKSLQTETAAELDALMPAILDRAFKGEL